MRSIRAALLMMVVLGCSHCATAPDASAVQGTTSGSGDLSKRFYQEVNRYRAQHGKPALERHRGLDRLAREHAACLVRNRGSFGLHGSNVSHAGYKARSRKARAAYGFGSMGENVAGGHATVREAVRALAKSRNHNHSMLSSWTSTGCAVIADKDGALFSVQLFGSLPVSRSQQWRDQMASF